MTSPVVPSVDTRVFADLGRIDRLLAAAASRLRPSDVPASPIDSQIATLIDEHARTTDTIRPLQPEGSALPPLARAVECYGLTSFERDVALLALACELDDRYGRILASLEGDAKQRRPTVGTMLRLLAELVAGEWTSAQAALGPGCRMFALGLLDFLGPGPHASREIALRAAFWPRLVGQPVDSGFTLVRTTGAELARLSLAAPLRAQVEAGVAAARRRSPSEVVLVVAGPAGSGRDALAQGIAGALGRPAILVEPARLHDHDAHRDLVREAVWHDAVVIVRVDGDTDAVTLARVAQAVPVPIIAIASEQLAREAATITGRTALELGLDSPGYEARKGLWSYALARHAIEPSIDPTALAMRFAGGPGRITAAVAGAAARATARGNDQLRLADLEDASRRGPPSGALVQRLATPYVLDDLVVPATTRTELELLLAWARHGERVFGPGGSGSLARRREGGVALFSGPPGTGKTMAAHVIAATLRRDLWRIDLSQVVNKYIGETEKNLDRVFASADADGAILFFDEADAIFGRRTEVRDAHDRYANLETAFLLQRIEDHRGTVILATNLERNVDPAFLRRIPIVAEFPMPGPAERQEIWRRHLDPARLAPDVDLAALAARTAMSGGDIRNAAATAALLAESESMLIGMQHLVVGAFRELRKAGRLVSADDLGPWTRHVPRPG